MPQTEGSVASAFCPAKADRMWDIAHAWVREDGREYCLLCGQEREARRRPPMPDRAVVDDGWFPSSDGDSVICDACGARRSIDPPAPRALVAISADRRVLVALQPLAALWVIHDFDVMAMMWLPVGPKIKDTGQSADAVLDAFLQQRGS